MRFWLLVTGIILLAGGISFYFYGNYLIQEVEAYDVYDIPISEFLKSINPELKFQYDKGRIAIAIGVIFTIVGIVLCIAGILVPTGEAEGKIREEKDKEAIEVLKLRYVKGEITKKEYEKMKKDIES